MVKDLYKLYDENKDSWIIQRGSGKAYSSGGDLLETLQNKPNMLEKIRYLYNFNFRSRLLEGKAQFSYQGKDDKCSGEAWKS